MPKLNRTGKKMAKKFEELRAGMTPQARANADAKAQTMLAEVHLQNTTHNPEFEEQMRVACEIMKARKAVLRDLAK